MKSLSLLSVAAVLVVLTLTSTVQSAPSAQSSLPKVSLYYESLCPFCHAFFLQQLAPTYEALKGHIEVELVPFGNVKVTEGTNGHAREFHCQHGEAECYGNRVHACGLALIHDKEQAFKFVKCNFAAANYRDTHHVGEKCAGEMHLDWAKLKSCVDGHQGDQLIEANWKKTASLSPRKTGVPWVTIDGVHTDVIQHEARNHLQAYLCTKYLKGVSVPACHH